MNVLTTTERILTNLSVGLQKAAISQSSNLLATSLVKGQSLNQTITEKGGSTSLFLSTLTQAVAEAGAKEIGNAYHGTADANGNVIHNISKSEQLALHGVLGAGISAATQSIAGDGVNGSGVIAGAAGAVIGEVAAEKYFQSQLEQNNITEANGSIQGNTIYLDASKTDLTLNDINQFKSTAVELSKLAGAISAIPFAAKDDNGGIIYSTAGIAGNSAENNALQIQVQRVAGTKNHLTIVHTPEPEEQKNYEGKDDYIKDPETGKLYKTWGAGPENFAVGFLSGITDKANTSLLSGSNRDRDADLSIKNYTSPNLVSPSQEGYYVQLLNNLDKNYQDNLRYNLLPNTNASAGYNSNSYISGLLIAADIVPPSIPDKNINYQWQGWEYDNSPSTNINYTFPFQVPGYDKPVPSQYFKTNE